MNKELSDEMKKISSGRLSRLKAEVPEGYFEELPGEVLKHWKVNKRTSKSTVIQIQKMIAAAALVSGVCLTIALFTHRSEENYSNIDITTAEAYNYIITHMDEFDSLLEEPRNLAEIHDFQMPESNALEDYLLQELDGSDIELFF